MLRLFHQSLESARTYSVVQLLGQPTISAYKEMVRRHIVQDPHRRILEVGCGVGSARSWFKSDYTGIDINPDYIERARRSLEGRFLVMDAGQLSFEPNSFDDAVSIATTHHLTGEQLSKMIRTATTLAPHLHIIDAILPVSPGRWFKSALFRMDRGRHVRSFDQLRTIVAENARLGTCEVIEGPLHDVCYIGASRTDR